MSGATTSATRATSVPPAGRRRESRPARLLERSRRSGKWIFPFAIDIPRSRWAPGRRRRSFGPHAPSSITASSAAPRSASSPRTASREHASRRSRVSRASPSGRSTVYFREGSAIYNATIEGRSSELVETTRAAGLAAAQQGRNLVDAWLVSIGVLVEYRNDGIGDARWLREADGSGDRSCCGA